MPKNMYVKKILTFDLARLFIKDYRLAGKYLSQAIKLYNNSFPSEERDPAPVVRQYIKEAVADIAGKLVKDKTYSYFVAVTGGSVKGMTSFNTIFGENTVAFVGYIAAQKQNRNMGIGQALIECIVKDINNGNRIRRKGSDAFIFVEIEQPDANKNDLMKDVIRPNFHTNHFQALIPVIERKNGECFVVPYKQPGIKDGKNIPIPVALLPGICRISDGKLLSIKPRLISNTILNGKLNPNVDILTMDKRAILSIFSCILHCAYRGEAYDQKQAEEIFDGIEKELRRSNRVCLIPISETAKLPFV